MSSSWFDRWPETQARLARWALLLGWLGLIAVLLKPQLAPPYRSLSCTDPGFCRPGIGNDLFWNIGLPLVILAVVLSHELWRRICPLSFVSQLFRALGWQRTVLNRAGKPQVVAVAETSWLARHHVQLQWSLLIAGLTLRLLIANSDGPILALLFAAALLAALISGWAFSGKAFCQYLCPFAPAQQILSGPRSLFSSPAHLGSATKTTQSMCRTLGAQGQEISACVACARPCFDIDAERTYWHSFSGRRGMAWAWYSYPGLILVFFLLIKSDAPAGGIAAGVDYLRDNLFAYDSRLAAMAWQSFLPEGWPPVPRLLAMPALLSAGGVLSERLFHWVEQLQQRQLPASSPELAKERAIHRTRLLASFAAINTYFFFKGTLLDDGSPLGSLELELLVMAISSVWLYRSWDRDRGVYERESTSTSLRRRLARLGPQLEPLLAGRQLDDLSPGEVFVLANALPAQETSQRRSIYLDVLRELISQGRLERTASLRALLDLRSSLRLDDADHQNALEILTAEDPRLASLSPEDLAGLTLCRNAAAQEVEDLLLLSGSTLLDPDRLDAHGRQRLERIRSESGLDEATWAALLNDFAPGSHYGRHQLDQRLQTVALAVARRESLTALTQRLPLAAPLVLSLDRGIARFLPDLVGLIRSSLSAAEDARPDHDCLALLRSLSPDVLAFLASEDATTTAINAWLESEPPIAAPRFAAGRRPAVSLPEQAAVLEELWLHPDPDVALWALMVLRQLDADRARRLHQTPRVGLPASEALTAFQSGQELPGRALLAAIAEQPLIQRLEPGTLLDLHRVCSLRHWRRGEGMERPQDIVWILVAGGCEQRRSLLPGSAPQTLAVHGAGEIVGLADYFGDRRSRPAESLVAAAEGCSALECSRTGFSALLDVSPIFEQSLIRELAISCEALQRALRSERQNQQHQRLRRLGGEQLAGTREEGEPPPPQG
ncbi:MAG: 4Fe-4S binding protein [Synechococcaceae cyanobacterium]|nr:4Fe-4S binding protein [Synechococcaceae cyanobacterium]